jgi:hypothetical protein
MICNVHKIFRSKDIHKKLKDLTVQDDLLNFILSFCPKST